MRPVEEGRGSTSLDQGSRRKRMLGVGEGGLGGGVRSLPKLRGQKKTQERRHPY